MYLFSTFILGSAASTAVALSGQLTSFMAKSGLFERQPQSCAPGSVECISYPNCYDPSQGEICCSDGTFCAVGYYCTNVGCCSIGNTLMDCGAAVSLSVIPPSTQPTSSAPTKSTSSTAKKTSSTTSTTASAVGTTKSSGFTTRTTSSTAGTTSSTAGTTSSITSTTKSASQLSSAPLSTTAIPNSTISSAFSATTSTPSQTTANAGQKLEGGVVGFTLCSLSFLLMLL